MDALLLLPLLLTPGDVTFEVAFTPEARAEALTGRAYVALSRTNERPPIAQAGRTGVPLFGRNVEDLAPGATATIDGDVFGYPVACTDDLPPGTYWAQPFFQVYTRFDRADGHTVWLPEDHWEGQVWRRKPGNLRGEPVQVTIGEAGGTFRLTCDEALPEIPFPEDTEHVKRFRIRSEILSDWWGRDIFFGATVLLPAGYDENPDVHYPVNYSQGHFSTRAPHGFGGRGAFTDWWLGPDAPRFLAVTFQHPTPYYDDSYAVNSENNGPYGDALTQELIPEVERRFRAIPAGWARLVSGGSTGGWEAFALQVFHPDDFGGCWALCPDSLDFRYHQIVDVYADENAYVLDNGWSQVERPCFRRTDGEVGFTMRQENHFELVVGDKSRSGGQWDIWEATFSPVGPDGYPMRIWDKTTGEIDHGVASYWREHYDLRHILERDWATLGPKLVGKLNVYVGDMDGYYLNNAVGLLETFLESTTDPHYDGEVVYERLAPHCWGPGGQELYGKMTAHLERYAPDGADLTSWRY